MPREWKIGEGGGTLSGWKRRKIAIPSVSPQGVEKPGSRAGPPAGDLAAALPHRWERLGRKRPGEGSEPLLADLVSSRSEPGRGGSNN